MPQRPGHSQAGGAEGARPMKRQTKKTASARKLEARVRRAEAELSRLDAVYKESMSAYSRATNAMWKARAKYLQCLDAPATAKQAARKEQGR
jgi:hypothetical protein